MPFLYRCKLCVFGVRSMWRPQHGDSVDLREIPSDIGDNQAMCHDVVLAKSILQKVL